MDYVTIQARYNKRSKPSFSPMSTGAHFPNVDGGGVNLCKNAKCSIKARTQEGIMGNSQNRKSTMVTGQ